MHPSSKFRYGASNHSRDDRTQPNQPTSIGSNLTLRSSLILGAALLPLALQVGCGPETPPYSELPLRDALSASPETLASLPEAARLELAQRLLEEHARDGDDATIADPAVPSVAVVVETADESREEDGKDALVLGAIEHGAEGFSLRALAIDGALETTEELFVIEGGADAPTMALEDEALRGKAGAVLSRMAEQSGAHRFVRVTGWPVGAVVADDKIYVNASWLVALSGVEPGGEEKAAVVGVPRAGYAPMLKPQSLDISPYDLPSNVDVCASAVEEKCLCASSSSCSHEPADPTFPDANAECSWVKQAAGNAQALCVLALMSVTEISQCVQEGFPVCEVLPVTDRVSAIAFVADARCMDYLGTCLYSGKAPTDGSSSGGSSGGSNCGGSSCGGSNCNTCKSCDSPDCDNSSCNNSSCDNSSCNNSNCGGGDCLDCKGGSCSLVGRRRRPAEPGGTPLAPVLMAASFVYIYNRVRRQS